MTKFEVLLCTYYYLEKEYFSDKNKSNEYEHVQYSSNTDEVVTVFSKCTLSDWEVIYDWVKNKRHKELPYWITEE